MRHQRRPSTGLPVGHAHRTYLLESLEGRTLLSVPEPNDTFASAHVPSENIYLEGQYSATDSVSSAGDANDYFKFYSLFGASRLYVALYGLSADADVYVYDQNQTLLASSTAGGNTSENINTVAIPANQYFYVRVAKYGAGATNYNLLLLNDYAGDALGSARDIETSWGQSSSRYWSYNKVFWGDYMDFRDNVDIVKFQMERTGWVDLRRLNTGGLQTTMQLLDQSGNVLATGAALGSGNALDIQHKLLTAGTYYVKFAQTAGSGDYSFRIVSDYAGEITGAARNWGDITNSTREDYDMVSNFGGNSYQDTLDLYKFTLSRTSPIDAYLTLPMTPYTLFDARMFIGRDTNGNLTIDPDEVIAQSNVTGNDTIHLAALGAGTYYLGVSTDLNYTSYQIDINSDLDKTSGAVPHYKNLSKAQSLGAVTGEQALEGGFGFAPGGDINDHYKFTLSAAAVVNVSAFRNGYFSRGAGNPNVSIIRDANGNQVIDAGETVASGNGSITAQLAAGTYYVQFAGQGGQLAYYGRIVPDFAGNTLAKARNMAAVSATAPPTQTFKDFIEQDFGPGSDIDDYYAFTLPADFTVTLKTTGVAGEDLSLTLIRDLNNNGVVDPADVIGTSNAANSPVEQVVKNLAPGKYFARVRGINGSTNYTLSAAFARFNDPDDTIAEVVNRAGNIKSPGQFVDFTLDPANDVDLVKFTVVAGQRIGFDVDSRNGSALDTHLRLFKSDGTPLASNNDGAAPGEPGSKFSYLEYRFATAGTYYVGVSLSPNGAYNPNTGAGDVNGGATGAFRMYLHNYGSTAPTIRRVNAGGPQLNLGNGAFFEADSNFVGGTTRNTAFAVNGTVEDPLYYAFRYGADFRYSAAMANGTYSLKLYFTEMTYSSAGQRKFDVFAEGALIINDLDVYSQAGAKSAYSIVKTISIVDGKIDLRFLGVVGNAVVSGIDLVKV